MYRIHAYMDLGLDKTDQIRALAEEAACSAHDLGLPPAEAPNADMAYEFMCDNIWNDLGEAEAVNPIAACDMPLFRLYYGLHMLILDNMTEVAQ